MANQRSRKQDVLLSPLLSALLQKPTLRLGAKKQKRAFEGGGGMDFNEVARDKGSTFALFPPERLFTPLSLTVMSFPFVHFLCGAL